MTDELDDRFQALLQEAEAIRELNDGSGHAKPQFKAWRQRAITALEDKLGPDSRPALEFRQLHFQYVRMVWTDSMPPVRADQHQAEFNRSLDEAYAILAAAREAHRRPSRTESAPLVHIEQVGNTTSSSASADVRVQVTVQQLRQLIATEDGLSPEDRSRAMAALPDDPKELTLEKVDDLLGTAAKAKGLFAPLLGWLITHADDIPWPT